MEGVGENKGRRGPLVELPTTNKKQGKEKKKKEKYPVKGQEWIIAFQEGGVSSPKKRKRKYCKKLEEGHKGQRPRKEVQ